MKKQPYQDSTSYVARREVEGSSALRTENILVIQSLCCSEEEKDGGGLSGPNATTCEIMDLEYFQCGPAPGPNFLFGPAPGPDFSFGPAHGPN